YSFRYRFRELLALSSFPTRRSSDLGKHPPEGPPICTALNFLSLGIPPPISYTTSLRVIPIGTSTNPVLFILPLNANTFVPLLFWVPIEENHSAPLEIIEATFENVSTLFITVGLPNNPASAG